MRVRTRQAKFARPSLRRRTAARQTQRPTQREVLRDVMLSAAARRPDGGWFTLDELARLTRFGETSISAQLRHLRQASCGGFIVEKRVREAALSLYRPEQSGALWEYRLLSPTRQGTHAPKHHRLGALRATRS